jgi:hypothetical protein
LVISVHELLAGVVGRPTGVVSPRGQFMKLSRILILLSFTLLFMGWLQADTVDPTHFFISLNDDGSDCYNGLIVGTTDPCDGEDSGGWGPVIGGVVQGIVNPGCPEEGCPTNTELTVFGPCIECFTLLSEDPTAGTRLGGKSDPITPTFTLVVDQFGGGAFDFQNNLGVPITTLSLSFTFPGLAPGAQLPLFCNGGDAFDNCGITASSDGVVTGTILFSGGHVEPTPEPSTWILLGTAAIAIASRRALRRA